MIKVDEGKYESRLKMLSFYCIVAFETMKKTTHMQYHEITPQTVLYYIFLNHNNDIV